MPIQLSGSGSITGVSTLTSLASLDVTGSVSVGGTLIYDDVTNIDSVGIVTARSDVHVGAGLSVTGISTFNDYLDINGDINIDGSQITYTSSSNQLKFADDAQLRLGTGNDLRLYHNGTHSYIQDAGIGNLVIQSNRVDIQNADGSENLAIFESTGAKLYHNDDKKFETTTTGVAVTGTLTASGTGGGAATLGSHLDLGDNQKVRLGASDDLDMYHDGTDSYIRSNTGQLLIRGNDIKLNNYLGTQTHAEFADGGLTTGAIDLSAISSSISDTAVDVFVYDTRKDSDGGAWRKRTQHTSWYNETLNTSTRGSRREFPAVAVIVAEANQVTIYDGDDPDLPMWMVFNTTSGNLIGGSSSLNAVTALNGIMVTPATGYTMETRFISDTPLDWFVNQLYEYNGNIEQRNDTLGFTLIESYGIINSTCNDVAMTVLPNAPIDDATGLPIPTIAVATNGGVSVITDSGSVYDLTTGDVYDVYGKVEFGDNNRLYYTGTNTQVLYSRAIPSADQNYTAYNTTNTNRVMFPTIDHGGFTSGHPVKLLGTNTSGNPLLIVKNKVSGSNETSYSPLGIDPRPGLSFIDEGETNPTSMVAYATTSYNTGWMHGDIKGAFLSDTDTTNVTSGEILTNGGFTNGTTGWTLQNASEGSISVASNQLTLNNSTSADPPVACYQQITVEVGKYYNVESNRASGLDVVVNITTGTSDGGGTGAYGNVILHTINGNAGATFLATQATMYCYIRVNTNATGSAVMNYVSIRKVEVDRSHNITFLRDKPSALTIHGTITKSAVATGADLVGYSGFSGSNYLKQPYNSSLSAGTGSQTFMGWVYATTDSTLRYLFAIGQQDSNEQFRLGFSNSVVYFDYGSGSAYSQWNSTDAIPDNKWTFVVATITAGQRPRIYIDGKLLTNTPAVNNAAPSTFLTATSYTMTIGINSSLNGNNAWNGSLALIRYSHSVPSPEQIKKMYEDEKVLFQENAKCTLYGSSDAVTALAYDEDTELLHVGTSSGRSDFQGLRRINNTTTAVTTAISASDDLIAEQ
jgi:hypothetical protein